MGEPDSLSPPPGRPRQEGHEEGLVRKESPRTGGKGSVVVLVLPSNVNGRQFCYEVGKIIIFANS